MIKLNVALVLLVLDCVSQTRSFSVCGLLIHLVFWSTDYILLILTYFVILFRPLLTSFVLLQLITFVKWSFFQPQIYMGAFAGVSILFIAVLDINVSGNGYGLSSNFHFRLGAWSCLAYEIIFSRTCDVVISAANDQQHTFAYHLDKLCENKNAKERNDH